MSQFATDIDAYIPYPWLKAVIARLTYSLQGASPALHRILFYVHVIMSIGTHRFQA